MRFMSIASGSSGNCIYAGNAGTDILIDVGISAKRIEEGLNSIGRSISDMDGILITHEHSDHIASLKVISKRYHLPLYATNGTINEILNVKGMEIEPALFNEVRYDREFVLKDMVIEAATKIAATKHSEADDSELYDRFIDEAVALRNEK